MNMDEKFRIHLLETFRVEADEHLKSMTFNLIELEKTEYSQNKEEIIEVIFRETHSLKGASRAVDQKDIEAICQAMESVLSVMKKKELEATTQHFDLFQQIVDFLGQILAHTDSERTSQEKEKEHDLIRQLDAVRSSVIPSDKEVESAMSLKSDSEILREKEQEPEPIGKQEKEPNDKERISPERTSGPAVVKEKVRVSASRLSTVLLQSEEMLSAKLAASQHCIDIRTANAAFRVWNKEHAKLQPLIQMIKSKPVISMDREWTDNYKENQRFMEKVIDFIEWNSIFIKTLEANYSTIGKSVERDSLILDGMVDNLLDDMKEVMMFPLSSILKMFPKVVRDMARDSGRKVDLVLKGGEIEIDRRILEEIKDPFIHLIRNAVDHGIEKPEDRKKKNKAESGTIIMEVFPKNHMVEIIISDDGAGINPDKVRTAALKSGTLSKAKLNNMTDQDILSYVYQSGVSTSPIITEFSGRGLGLAIVREKVEKLGGTISLKSKYGVGTQFQIVLPLTIATFRGILVRVSERLFVIPTMYVERVVRIKREAIQTIGNRDTIRINGGVISFVRLSDVLEFSRMKSGAAQSEYMQVIILSDGGTHIAVNIDEVLHEQEVLFKSLGKLLSRVQNIAGATVLGTGMAVPIINVSDLMKSAIKASISSVMSATQTDTQEQMIQKPSVLVVEDSITTRTLLKNILETADYHVTTAVDGLAAYTLIKSENFDAVVTDINMPRMNGFDLTVKIRNHSELKEMPVVLITSLESREDKERGIDVGADAYIVKSSFDQSNLLEVLNRLIIMED